MPKLETPQQKLEQFVSDYKEEIKVRIFLINLLLLFDNEVLFQKKSNEYAALIAKELSPHSDLYPTIKNSFYLGMLSTRQQFFEHLKILIKKRAVIFNTTHHKQLLKLMQLYYILRKNKPLSEDNIYLISVFLGHDLLKSQISLSSLPRQYILGKEDDKWKMLHTWCGKKDRIPFKKRDYFYDKLVFSIIKKGLIFAFFIFFSASCGIYLSYHPEFQLLGLSAVSLCTFITTPVSLLLLLGFCITTIPFDEFRAGKFGTLQKNEANQLSLFLTNSYQIQVIPILNAKIIRKNLDQANDEFAFHLSFSELPRTETCLNLAGEKLPRNPFLIRSKSEEKTKGRSGKTEATVSDQTTEETNLIDETGNDIVRTLTYNKTLMTLRLPKQVLDEANPQKIAPFEHAFRNAHFGTQGTCIRFLSNKNQIEVKVSHNKYRLFGIKTVNNDFIFETFKKGLGAK